MLLAEAPPQQMPYAHLDPIVDYLLANGNKLAYDFRWGSDREGFYCHLLDPIDFDGLERNFVFPSTIRMGRARNVIVTDTGGCIIKTVKP